MMLHRFHGVCGFNVGIHPIVSIATPCPAFCNPDISHPLMDKVLGHCQADTTRMLATNLGWFKWVHISNLTEKKTIIIKLTKIDQRIRASLIFKFGCPKGD